LEKGWDISVIEFVTYGSCFGMVMDVEVTILGPGCDAANGLGNDGFNCLDVWWIIMESMVAFFPTC